MGPKITRRDFARLSAFGGAVFASGLWQGAAATPPAEDFYFVQLSDLHWGFEGPPNPEAKTTLKRAIAEVNAMPKPPDFVVFTGDLTHTTDDDAERRRRMAEVKTIIGGLNVRDIKFLAGEHDASLDWGAAFKDHFGPTRYTFDHKGVHFIALDNVSDPGGQIGKEQLDWLAADLGAQPKAKPVVVLTHRPLFDLYPQWDWATRDGAAAIEILQTHPKVTVFYGHIHQENHFMTGAIAHHSAKSLIFALPAPGSTPKRTPVAWDPAEPFRGLGFRSIEAEPETAGYELYEMGIKA